MKAPLVSVVMSVYNGAYYVPTAIRSILDQSFRNLEFMVINDGSNDDTGAVLDRLARELNDPRLRIEHLPHVGLSQALNYGISLANGYYIARQDHDDISQPERLAQQVSFMEMNPAVGLLGTRAEIWVEDQPTDRAHDHATGNAALQFDLLFNNPFVHSSILMRRCVLDVVGLYTTDLTRQPPEDYELWSRIARRFEVANLDKRLVVYREVPGSVSRITQDPFHNKLLVICAENLAAQAGLTAVEQTCRDAAALVHSAYEKLDPKADIEAICGVLTHAARRIEASNAGADISDRLDRQLINLRSHFAAARRPRWLRLAQRLPIPADIRSLLRRWHLSRLSASGR